MESRLRPFLAVPNGDLSALYLPLRTTRASSRLPTWKSPLSSTLRFRVRQQAQSGSFRATKTAGGLTGSPILMLEALYSSRRVDEIGRDAILRSIWDVQEHYRIGHGSTSMVRS